MELYLGDETRDKDGYLTNLILETEGIDRIMDYLADSKHTVYHYRVPIKFISYTIAGQTGVQNLVRC